MVECFVELTRPARRPASAALQSGVDWQQPAALCGFASPGRAPERGSNLQPSDGSDTIVCATSDLLARVVFMDRGATIDLVRSATPSPLDEAHDLLRIMGPAYPMRVLIPSLVLGVAPYQGYN